MKKATKIALILAAALIVTGIGAIIGGLATVNFDLSRLDKTNYITTETVVEESFTEISVICDSADVTILPAEDGICRVVFTDQEEASHSAEVRDGVLQIAREDNRNWYDLVSYTSFFHKSPKLCVYLPVSDYDSLSVKTTSGDISVPDGFRFGTAELKSTSGDISCLADVRQGLRVKATSGDILLEGVSGFETLEAETTSGGLRFRDLEGSDSVKLKATSGDVKGSGISCGFLAVETTSGDISLDDLTLEQELLLDSTSGDVSFFRCTAEKIAINTTSGDVSGSVRNEMRFRCDSNSGDVVVPYSSIGGLCTINTTSGDIEVSKAG